VDSWRLVRLLFTTAPGCLEFTGWSRLGGSAARSTVALQRPADDCGLSRPHVAHGGLDERSPEGHGATSEVWASGDGKDWEQVTAKAGWSPRLAGGLIEFRDRLWVLGAQRTITSVIAAV
jgi:hypothetical protein